MRTIVLSDQCLEFIDKQNEKVGLKFFEIIEVISGLAVIHEHYVKKLSNTTFYELRFKMILQYRIILYSVDHANINQCSMIYGLYAFHKKSKKDYRHALKRAVLILNKFLDAANEND